MFTGNANSMLVHNLSENNTILNQFIAELRDKTIQKDSMRFRRNIERIGEIFAYEISNRFDYSAENIQTPLAETLIKLPNYQLVIASILRAGIPLHQGLLNYLDQAESAFISAYRKYESETKFKIAIEYAASPDLTGKTLILADPMLASGKSMYNAYKSLTAKAKTKKIHLICIFAAPEGIAYLKEHINEEVELWVGVIDEKLNKHSYIIPGLGDAGDLAYGEKV